MGHLETRLAKRFDIAVRGYLDFRNSGQIARISPQIRVIGSPLILTMDRRAQDGACGQAVAELAAALSPAAAR